MKKTVIVAMVILIILSMVSCKDTDKNNLEIFNGTESYNAVELFKDIDIDIIEEVIPFDDGNFLILGVNFLSNKDIGEKSRKAEVKYLIVDERGNTLRELDIDRLELNYYGITISSDKNINFLGFSEEEDVRFIELYTYNSEGKLLFSNKLELKEDINSTRFKKVKINDKEIMYGLTLEGNILVVDNECNILNFIDEEKRIVDFDFITDNKILLLETGRDFVKYDIDKKEITERNELDDHLGINNIEYNEESNLVYCDNVGNISILNEDGKFKEKVFNYKLNTQISEITKVFEYQGDIYLFARTQDKSNHVFKLEKMDNDIKDDSSKNQDKLIIAINNLNSKESFESAIQEFRALNSNIKIELVESGDLSKEQFQQVINTELMAGRGPDIFFGYFPFDTYIQQEALIDLKTFMESDENYNKDDYVNNIVELTKVNGKQYVFPVSFNFPKLYVNKKVLDEHEINIDEKNWTLTDMAEIVEKLCGDSSKGKYYSLHQGGSHYMSSIIIDSYIETQIDQDNKTTSIDTTELKQLLETLKQLKEAEYHKNFGTNPNILFGVYSFDAYNYKIALPHKIYSFEDYKLVKMPKWYDGSGQLFGARFIGINSNTKFDEESWEFIKFILSEQYGIEYGDVHDFSINKNANTWKNQLYLKGEIDPSTKESKSFEIKVNKIDDKFKMTKEHSDKLKTMIEERDYYSFLNLPINQEIYKFLNDEQDIDQTISVIQNKIELFIGE